MFYRRRQFLKHAIAGFSGVALSSCGWTLAKVQTDRAIATSSDELHIYTWANYIDQDIDRYLSCQNWDQSHV